VRLAWSHPVSAQLRGLALAREAGTVLAWDSQGLYRFNVGGGLEVRGTAPGPVTACCAADDGSGYGAVGAEGQVWLLGPDFVPRWERSQPRRPLAVALEPLGAHLAVADAGGGLSVYDPQGRLVWQASSPRPLHFLAFVPEQPALLASADFGLVCCFGHGGRVVWRNGLVAHVGSLAVSGTGTALLACFTEGLCVYPAGQPRQQRLPRAGPCRLAALSYSGEVVLTAGLENQVSLRDRKGVARAEQLLEGPPVALALGPLGDHAVLALADGRVLRLDLD
jgi:hypothetical protein